MSITELDRPSGATVELLQAIGKAFNSHDVDAIVDHFADDGIFDNAMGPDIHGERHTGKDMLRSMFTDLFTRCPDIQWHAIDDRVDGDKGFSEWRRQATLPDGSKQDWLGRDIFTIRDGKIAKKDTYFKIVI